MMKRDGFYTHMYYAGCVDGKWWSFETEEAYNEYMDEKEEKEEKGEKNEYNRSNKEKRVTG